MQLWALAGDGIRPLPRELFSVGSQWTKQLAPPVDDALPISTANIPLRSGSRRVLLSDLLFPVEPDDLLRPLTARNGSISVLAPWHGQEADPDWRGVCQLDDSETQTMREIEFDASTLKRYRDAYGRHFENWQRASRRHAASLSRIPSGGALAAALGAELSTLNPSVTA